MGHAHDLKTATYDQVADEDLKDLSLEAGATTEDLLQDANEDVAQRRADERAVEGHLGHSRREVVAMLAPVVGNPRGEEFLETREGTGRQHLGAQGVALELLQIGLWWTSVLVLPLDSWNQLCAAYREISIYASALGQSLADLVCEVFFAFPPYDASGSGLSRLGQLDRRLLLKLDRHSSALRGARFNREEWGVAETSVMVWIGACMRADGGEGSGVVDSRWAVVVPHASATPDGG